ncbi:integration host factor subunit beta [candidate division KSB1 bacterium]|nr:integration host factor subunit beta [candidate division KSB1 bacterium]MCH8285838.1 integration host factor subunit beta [candidate division KSB1 bacterium]
MTKAEVVSIIANATGLTKVETEAVVNGFITTIRDSLKEGKGIEIRGFGTFKVREKKPRIARNPRTGEKVNIPKKFVPVFKPSKELKNIIDKEHKAK